MKQAGERPALDLGEIEFETFARLDAAGLCTFMAMSFRRHKRVEWLLVAGAVVEALEGLKLDFPKAQGRALAELKSIERALKAKKWD